MRNLIRMRYQFSSMYAGSTNKSTDITSSTYIANITGDSDAAVVKDEPACP